MNLLHETFNTANEAAKATVQVTAVLANSVNELNKMAKESSPTYAKMAGRTWQQTFSTQVAEENWNSLLSTLEIQPKPKSASEQPSVNP